MIGAVGNTQLTMGRTWLIVVQHAGYRCECIGQCGQQHAPSAGRCFHESPTFSLIVTAADLTASTVTMCRANADQLRAWCPACLDRATRKARRDEAGTGEIPGQLSLVDVELDEVVGVPA
jgi:hypothetical protein